MRAHVACVAGALLVAVGAPRAAALEEADPASIAGTWQYRTQSNCGSVEGVGKLWFGWNAQRELYDERGMVFWADTGSTITWWGTARFDRRSRALRASVDNSLGDHVDSRWRIEGNPPARLIVRWTQTNGCHGVGIATRSASWSPRR